MYQVTVPPDVTGQDFVGEVPDIGFQPNVSGYKFSNYGGAFPWPPIDLVIDDIVNLFGSDAVCAIQQPFCLVKPVAYLWWWNTNQAMNHGHCDGMALTSLRFYKELDNPATFQASASTTHDLELDNVRRHIAYYFVEQLTDPVRGYKQNVRKKAPSAILDQLSSAMSNGADDPTTLFVRSTAEGGHVITPYAIEDQGGGVYWIKVYDNNWPDDATRHVVIDTINDTWSYDLGEPLGTWTGSAETESLGIVPISKYAEQPVCPWRTSASTMSGPPFSQLWLTGAGHLLVTDAQGRRIGYSGNQFLNEIPMAYESSIDGGLGVETEPIYTLPLTQTYSILLDGQTLTQTQMATVTEFGPGYATAVEGVTVGPWTLD